MSSHKCYVMGCDDKFSRKHRFPHPVRRPRTYKTWLELCGNKSLFDRDPLKVYESCRICHKHFAKESLARNDFLQKGAIPTLFLPQEVNVKEKLIEENSFLCAVLECKSKPTDNVIFFEFPEDPETSKIWVEFCNRPELKTYLPFFLTKRYKMCSLHFKKEMFFKPEYTRLKPSAVPNLLPHTDKSNISNDRTSLKIISGIKEGVVTIHQDNPTVNNIELDQFDILCDKYLPAAFATLVKSQARLKLNESDNAEFNIEFKQFALALYCIEPRCYTFFEKLFFLPTKLILQRTIHKLPLLPGVQNLLAYDFLMTKLKILEEKDKHCLLCIDEFPLKPMLFHHLGRNEIIGLENIGNVKKPNYAKSVIVMMVRGLYTNWTQVFTYFFVGPLFSIDEFKNSVLLAIWRLETIGYQVNGIVTKVRPNMINLAHTLKVSVSQPYITCNNKNYVFCFDTSQLLIATRNHLLFHHFVYDDNKRTFWTYIKQFYDKDRNQQSKLAPNLTDLHLKPSKADLKSFEVAREVIDSAVVNGMSVYVQFGALPKHALETIEVIKKFNKLFNMLNATSRKVNSDNHVFKGDVDQISFFNEMLQFLDQIKIYKRNGEIINDKGNFRKTWLITISAIQMLWDNLSKKGFDFLVTKRVNLNCLKTFFEELNANTTPIQFERSFRKRFRQDLMKCSHLNFKQDFSQVLSKINNINLPTSINDTENTISTPKKSPRDLSYRSQKIPVKNGFISVCKYVVKQLIQKHGCTRCLKLLQINQIKQKGSDLVYINSGTIQQQSHIVTEEFIAFMMKLEHIFVTNFLQAITASNVEDFCKTKMISVTYSLCPQFPRNYVVELFIRLRLFTSLRYANRMVSEQRNTSINILSHL